MPSCFPMPFGNQPSNKSKQCVLPFRNEEGNNASHGKMQSESAGARGAEKEEWSRQGSSPWFWNSRASYCEVVVASYPLPLVCPPSRVTIGRAQRDWGRAEKDTSVNVFYCEGFSEWRIEPLCHLVVNLS